MQQLQRPASQQLQSWQRQHVAQCRPGLLAGSCPADRLQATALHGLQLRCNSIQHVRRIKRKSTGADAGAGTGDVVRPSAQAAAPSAAPVDLTGQSSQTSATSTGKGSNSSGYSSFSDIYKSLNSTKYSRPVDSSSPKTKHSSNNPSSTFNGPSAGKYADKAATVISSDGHVTGHSSGTTIPAATTPSSTSAVDAANVEDAIRKAQEALAAAENSLNTVPHLRSAQPASRWHGLLQLLRTVAIIAASGALLVASHAFGLGWQWAGATLGALGLAARAYYRETVTPAGAAVVAAASLATLGCSLRFGLVMLAYSYTSHKLRQYKETKTSVDYEQLTKPVQTQAHDWPEISCIAFLPTVLAVAYGAMAGCLDLPLGSLPAVETWRADLLTLLQGAVLGWYACCCGDAWASELGSLSSDQPRLVTTLKPVRRGTHGAITLLGLSGAAAGGLLMGSLFYCAAVLSPTLWVFEVQRQAAMTQWKLIPLGLIAGVFGSLADSLLGAALQFTGYNSDTASLSSAPGPGVSRISGWFSHKWISDNVINVLAGSLTAMLTAVAALRMFG